MKPRTAWHVLLLGLGSLADPISAQDFPSQDVVIRHIWTEGMEHSRAYELGQVLMDSLGPRLTGTPGQAAAADWVVRTYRGWAIEASNEAYGTWRGWRRGITHIDLLKPRVRSLEGTMLAWSPGTDGPVEAPAVAFPRFDRPEDFLAFLPTVRDRFVLVSMAQPTCRPDEDWEEYATEASLERMTAEREAAIEIWGRGIAATGLDPYEIVRRLEAAGAAGMLSSWWPNGWGVSRVSEAATDRVPALVLSCEDYGLVFRLASRNQGPLLRVEADAEFLGHVPVANTIARIPGGELPEEYVLLSAHFDSWDGASGATDNGTGTITMMEAMRILRTAYPNPRRTILAGHWNGEEQGLNGSRAFAHDHPEIVRGLQAVFNQDSGTGRIVRISMQGLAESGAALARWFAMIPADLTKDIELEIPGQPSRDGSDYASFICGGAPTFPLGSLEWSYSTYTWHTNRDTFDKVVIDDVKRNATLTAMLAYLASEHPEKLSRSRSILPTDPRTGERFEWPDCRDGARQIS